MNRFNQVMALLFGVLFSLLAEAKDPTPPPVSKEIFEQWMTELSNWGRWGKEDELGTLNLITSKKRQDAVKLIEEGVTVSLALDVNTDPDVADGWGFKNKFWALAVDETVGFAMERYDFPYHGALQTHLDGIAHTMYRGKMYNDLPLAAVKSSGLEKLGVHNYKNGLTSRAVLIDVPRLKGIPYLEPGTAVTVEDIEAWERKTGVRIGEGDILLVRVGRWEQQEQAAGKYVEGFGGIAGVHVSVVPWLKRRGVAMLGSDSDIDVKPSGIKDFLFPVHVLTQVAMGMPLFDNLNLDEVAEESAKRQRWEFYFVALPLRIPGGTGSPVNPIAIF